MRKRFASSDWITLTLPKVVAKTLPRWQLTSWSAKNASFLSIRMRTGSFHAHRIIPNERGGHRPIPVRDAGLGWPASTAP
ncbi:MAG: hypothetical protein ABSF96_11010 [Steroidobacteraceae bacterium]|jgi:hypothetical protein